jgi:hypothetical protein
MNERITRPTQRPRPTKLATSKNGKVLVLGVGQSWVEFDIPSNVTHGVIKNTKAVEVEMRFDGDPEANSWPLESGEQTPPGIEFPFGGKLWFKAKAPSAEIRAIFW